MLQEAVDDGFKCMSVFLADVILAVSHFTSQVRGKDQIPHSVVVKDIPSVSHFLLNAQLIALKKFGCSSGFRP